MRGVGVEGHSISWKAISIPGTDVFVCSAQFLILPELIPGDERDTGH